MVSGALVAYRGAAPGMLGSPQLLPGVTRCWGTVHTDSASGRGPCTPTHRCTVFSYLYFFNEYSSPLCHSVLSGLSHAPQARGNSAPLGWCAVSGRRPVPWAGGTPLASGGRGSWEGEAARGWGSAERGANDLIACVCKSHYWERNGGADRITDIYLLMALINWRCSSVIADAGY